MSQANLDALNDFNTLVTLADEGDDIARVLCGHDGDRADVPMATRSWVKHVDEVRERYPKLPDVGDISTLVDAHWSGDENAPTSRILERIDQAAGEIFSLALAPFQGEPDSTHRFLLLYELYEADRHGAGLVLHGLSRMFGVDHRRIDKWLAWTDSQGYTKLGRASNRRGSPLILLTTEGVDAVEGNLGKWRQAAAAERADPSQRTDGTGAPGGNNKSGVTMKVFISHSSADRDAASAFVEFLRASLPISASEIRCTSVDGFKLAAGTNAEDQLRQEVYDAEIFVALLSPNSLSSVYVMFELGARWGAKKYLVPLMIGNLTPSQLRAPLSAIHAVVATSEGDMHDLVGTVADRLNLQTEKPNVYIKAMQSFMVASAAVTKKDP